MRFCYKFAVLLIYTFLYHLTFASGLPVRNDRPRILLTPGIITQLRAKMNANDPLWIELKASADRIKTYSIYPYKWSTRTNEPAGTIFYDYQGEGWFGAAFPLGFAYVMTGDISYSNKLLELADEMIRAQADPDNMAPVGFSPLAPGNYYPTRNICPVIAMIFDWCYDQLGATRKTAMINLMNAYFDDMRMNAYQRNDHSDGNYFVGHMIAAAWMGYALYGDNPRAQTMVDYARMRFDNSASALIDADSTPEDYFAQLFEGGFRPQAARQFNGPFITAAPFIGGIDFQGWAYGTETFNRVIDYLQIVKTATGEDLFPSYRSWFSQILRMHKHNLMPNRFEIWPTGDWGGDYGAVISRSLPVRLASILAGTPDGPGAQHFAYSEIAKISPYPDFPDNIYQEIRQPTEWEAFYYTDTTRTSAELVLPPYYSGFEPVYPQAGMTNGAMPYFFMRSDWGEQATWASIHMGAAFYDDHQHFDAGHIWIKRGNDYLLIDASNWKGALGSIGIVGSSLDEEYSSCAVANTLHFNDFGDSQPMDMSTHGGQSGYGKDEVVADEQNLAYSYIRSDLSTAYNNGADTTDLNLRKLDFFYRNFLYLRHSNLFFIYDQVKAMLSMNPLGPYRKHLRWHFPARPIVTGNSVLVEKGDSRLHMVMLSPDNTQIKSVDEMTNPDPCDGSITPCTPYGMDSGTWRIEVGDSNNPLYIPFLTLLQSGSLSTAAPVAVKVTTNESNMTGARIVTSDGNSNIVLFNSQETRLQSPITSASYSIPSPSSSAHTLCGMKPNAKFAVSIVGNSVAIAESPSGTLVSSQAGVLQFGLLPSAVHQTDSSVPAELALDQNYPNPFHTATSITFTLPTFSFVSLKLFDVFGREVETILNEQRDKGTYTIEWLNRDLRIGIYFYQLRSGNTVLTKQLVLLK